MTQQHTPGGWTARPHPNQDSTYVVYDVFGDVLTYDEDEDEANARLIAAAPDLLAACQAIDEMWSDDGEGGRCDPIDARSDQVRVLWTAARAAIARATGGAA